MKERTAQDFAIEHAEYMAQSAEQLLEALQEHAAALMALEDDGNDPDSDADFSSLQDRCARAEEAMAEAMAHMRSGIYEFRKRRDRAATKPAPAGKEAPLTLAAQGKEATE